MSLTRSGKCYKRARSDDSEAPPSKCRKVEAPPQGYKYVAKWLRNTFKDNAFWDERHIDEFTNSLTDNKVTAEKLGERAKKDLIDLGIISGEELGECSKKCIIHLGIISFCIYCAHHDSQPST